MNISLNHLPNRMMEITFIEERGILDIDSQNDEYVEGRIKAQEHFDNQRLMEGDDKMLLYDLVDAFGIQPERYFIFFGWEKGDKIQVTRFISPKKIMLQFKCRIL